MSSSLRATEPQRNRPGVEEGSNDSYKIHSPSQHTLPSLPSPSQHTLPSLPSPSPPPQPPTPSSSASSTYTGSDRKAAKRKAPEDEVAVELLKAVRESEKLDVDEQFFNSCLPM
ncbi:hypothetical protein ElyMa_005553100 [Elysia marginata]|uniref:BESS domain-containing protein n=1 Tax=Elysia marginata TaxID=1093978 RepID=A0AAV4EYU8_9GAST|nr:hypothetical protein ElyMa_005553100 [Elysia marginata]